jgi:hypothetical protein
MQNEQLRKLSKELKDNLSRLQEQRSNFESHWQEVADVMLPRRADITKERAKGDKRNIEIYDSTAIHALELLASSLHGMLTSSAQRWFSLRFKEPAANDVDEAREWLDDVTNRMYVAFSRSNFQQEVFECYHDLIAFGTACLLIEEDKEDTLRFSSRHIKELYIMENAKGYVDTVYRKFKLSAAAIVNKFGIDNVSSSVQTTFKKSPMDEISCVHVVRPRPMFNDKKMDKKNMPYESIYFEYENGHIINIGGFKELPYVVPRYLKGSSEIYGRSPGMNALPDVKVLNKIVEISLKAAAKMVDPPLLVPDDSMIMPVRTSPGSINYYRSGSRDKIEPLQIGANNPLGLNLENQRRDSIAKIFYADQIMISENRNMTATEVTQRNEERMRILGPALSRLQTELLQPMIFRVFNIMLRNKLFPQAPEILLGQEIDIEYVSPLFLAQKSTQLSSIMRGLEIFGSLGQVAPVADYLDENGLVKEIINILGLPAKMIKSDAQVRQKREQQAQMQQEQMQMQQQMQQAEMARNAAPMVKALNGQQPPQQ